MNLMSEANFLKKLYEEKYYKEALVRSSEKKVKGFELLLLNLSESRDIRESSQSLKEVKKFHSTNNNNRSKPLNTKQSIELRRPNSHRFLSQIPIKKQTSQSMMMNKSSIRFDSTTPALHSRELFYTNLSKEREKKQKIVKERLSREIQKVVQRQNQMAYSPVKTCFQETNIKNSMSSARKTLSILQSRKIHRKEKKEIKIIKNEEAEIEGWVVEAEDFL